MSTITKEWLQHAINDYENCRNEPPFGLSDHQEKILVALRIALASLEAEPVGYIDAEYADLIKSGNIESCSVYAEQGEGCITVFSVPPAPECLTRPVHPRISSEELDDETLDELIDFRRCTFEYHSQQDNKVKTIIHGVTLTAMLELRDRRAAMLQGAEPVTTACKLRDAVEIIRNSGIAIDAEKILAERDALNAPDCWCRTCRPITLTDMRFVVCPECGNKRCPHANDHRNACTGSNEPGQEGSAYPAAPQQEVKP